MAFPTSPTNGQQANVNGVIYIYSSTLTAWTVLTNTGANVSANNIAATNTITTAIICATGNINSGNIITTGNILPSANNVYNLGSPTAAWASVYISANTMYLGATPISTSGNSLVVNGNSVVTANASGTSSTTGNVAITGNITGNNVLTSGVVSATGNVTGNYILGNGSQLTGIATGSSSNINSGTSNVTIVSSGGNATVGIGGTANIAVFATTGEYVTGLLSASGNITGANILTAGIMSSTGNAIHGNILTAGLVSATGNITGGNILTAGLISATSTITSAANITGGNLSTAGIMSSTGNVQAGNIRTVGLVSATGNIITAGGILIGPGSAAYPLVVSGNANAGVVAQVINANTGTSASSILQLQTSGANYVNYSVNGSSAYSAIQGVGTIVTNYYDFNSHSFRNNAGNQQLLIGNGGAAVNYLTLQGSLTTVALPITATGTDANISINLAPKGSGNVTTPANLSVAGNITTGNLIISGAITDSGQLNIQTTGANGNIVLTPNGTGNVTTPANVSVAGNILSGNILISSAISVGGNITSHAILETATITAAAPAAPTNFDIITQAIQYYTANANANVTLNFRGSSTVTANALLAIGQSTTVALLWTNGATAFYPNVIQVDGSNVTPKWQGGTAITSGNANATDVYSFTIIKTAATPTYVVLGSQTKFA